MKDIENYLPLFTSVTEGLPEGIYFGLCESDPVFIKIHKAGYVSRFRYQDGSVYNSPCKFTRQSLLILDLSKLTTKEKAVKLAEEAYERRNGQVSNTEKYNFQKFIENKQKEL